MRRGTGTLACVVSRVSARVYIAWEGDRLLLSVHGSDKIDAASAAHTRDGKQTVSNIEQTRSLPLFMSQTGRQSPQTGIQVSRQRAL